MKYDVFFSISQTPVDGHTPDEPTMLRNFFDQVQLADRLGYGIAWVAQAHLSTEIQKRNVKPVVPHFQGEIGLCTDFFQLAHKVFACTSNIEVGSAVMSLMCNGGPIGIAERIGNFCTLHGLNPDERRRLHIGFATGRFEFMGRPYGFVPRDAVEAAAWPALKGQIFLEASDVFLRLLRGEVLSSKDTYDTVLTRSNFRSDADWENVQQAAHETYGHPIDVQKIPICKRYVFEEIKTIPQDWDRSLLSLIVGSHDPAAQQRCNQWMPTKVFNLSITNDEVIDRTHARMTECFNADGGEWKREYMPRTAMVFLNNDVDKNQEERDAAAYKQANHALSAYWKALQGTLDPKKVEAAANNALIGSPETIAQQMVDRYNSEDRLMLWFDFFNHNSEQVCGMMEGFQQHVVPIVEQKLRATR